MGIPSSRAQTRGWACGCLTEIGADAEARVMVAGEWFSLPIVTHCLGAAFWPGAFAVGFFATDSFAADSFTVDVFTIDVFAVEFFAVKFFAVKFFTVKFFAIDFFAIDFFAVNFIAADFLADMDLAPIKNSIEESDHEPKRRNSKVGETYR